MILTRWLIAGALTAVGTPSIPPASPSIAAPGPGAMPVLAARPAADAQHISAAQLQALRKKGEQLYATTCAACHQSMGEGMPGVFPPLAGSEYTNTDPDRHIRIVLGGRSGAITVQGNTYNGTMPSFNQLSNDDIAAIVTYERTSWGNHGGAVTPDQVKAQR